MGPGAEASAVPSGRDLSPGPHSLKPSSHVPSPVPLLPLLETLVLSGIPVIGQRWVLDAIASHATRLRWLGLGHLHVPPEALAEFLQRVGDRLVGLQLAWSPAVATRSMRDIAVSCTRLERLDISGVSGVREHAILELVRTRAAVESAQMDGERSSFEPSARYETGGA